MSHHYPQRPSPQQQGEPPADPAQSNGHRAASGYPAGNGHLAANGYPPATGHPAANGYPAANRHPVPSGYAAASGYPAANGHPAPSGYPAANGHPAPSGHAAPSGYAVGNGHPTANGRPVAVPGHPPHHVAAPFVAGPSAQYAPAPRPAQWAPPRRPRRRRVALEVVIASIGGLGALAMIALIAVTPGANSIALTVVLALVPLTIVGSSIVWVDRWEPEPRLLLLAAFLWGGGVATWLSSILNGIVGPAIATGLGLGWDEETASAVLGAPVVEEFWKGLGLLVVFLARRRYFNGPVDGIVYASVIAAAFAFVENIQYFAYAGESVGVTFVLRGLVVPFGHLIYTACMGLALGWAARQRSRWAWVWALPLGYAMAVGLHALWNGMAGLVTGLGGLFLLVLLVKWLPLLGWTVLVVWLRRREVDLLRARLGEYVPSGWLAGYEVEMLSTLPGRRQARTWAARGGAAGLRAMKRFQRTAVALAYARQDLHTGHTGIRARTDELELLEELGSSRAGFRAVLGV